MKPQAWIIVAACASLSISPSLAKASVLLASFSMFQGSGFSPCPQIGPVEFYLGLDVDPASYPLLVGQGLRSWTDGESGTFDITPANEPLFPDLASRLTDGIINSFCMLDGMQGCNDGYGGGVCGPESNFFPPPGDLAGNQLDFIRLYVSNVNIEVLDPTIQWVAWTADVTYEFWGMPLPEPVSALLVLFGPMLSRRMARSHRSR